MVAYLVKPERDITGGALCETLHTFIYNEIPLAVFCCLSLLLLTKSFRSMGLLIAGVLV